MGTSIRKNALAAVFSAAGVIAGCATKTKDVIETPTPVPTPPFATCTPMEAKLSVLEANIFTGGPAGPWGPAGQPASCGSDSTCHSKGATSPSAGPPPISLTMSSAQAFFEETVNVPTDETFWPGSPANMAPAAATTVGAFAPVHMMRIVPGDHENSYLWKKIMLIGPASDPAAIQVGTNGISGFGMPIADPGAQPRRLNPCEVQAITAWIDSGALFN